MSSSGDSPDLSRLELRIYIGISCIFDSLRSLCLIYISESYIELEIGLCGIPEFKSL